MAIDRSLKYENLHTNYTYGSLAIDDFWAPEEKAPKVKKVAKPRPKVVAKPKSASHKLNWNIFQRARKPLVQEEQKVLPKPGFSYKPRLLKICGVAAFGMIMVTYLICVVLGQLTAATQLELVALQRQETELMNETNELRISVEQLKGPERIREIATGQLGMVVARDNVYVKAVKVKTIGDFYKNAAPAEENIFYALAK